MIVETTTDRDKNYSRWLFSITILLLFLTVIYLHNYKLDSIPLGLFFDESTIGIQASNLSRSGFDIHDEQGPIFFKSDSDYDSPILIYSTAAIFKVLGVSEYTLRLPNLIFFSIALFLAFYLATRLFKENRFIWVYCIIAFGFLPQLFTISRLSFEAISQLACLAGVCLCVWWAFQQSDAQPLGFVKPALSGLLLGISVYTYSTASLLSALFMLSLLLIYYEKKNLSKLISLIVACLVALIPYAVFSLKNPGALTSRFKAISFLYEQLPFVEKLRIFQSNYFSFWSLDFLIKHGDSNLRHSTGVGGIVFLSVFILFIIGLADFFLSLLKKDIDKFRLLLVINLFVTPIASAMTSEGNPHAVRAILLGYFMVIISCYGFQRVLSLYNKTVRGILLVFIFALLGNEVYKYQFDYFAHYAARSVDAIGSYDFYGAIEFALEEAPNKIVLLDNFPGIRDNFLFYGRVVDNPNNIPMQVELSVVPEPGLCVIFRRQSGAEEYLDRYPIPYDQFTSKYRPTVREKYYGAEPFFGVMKARCYKDGG